jgi:deoxyxylulose-5-phosphate synthase
MTCVLQKPLDLAKCCNEVFAKFNKIITIEDGTIVGGIGSAILEFMNCMATKHENHGNTRCVSMAPKQLYDEIELM